MPPPFLPSSPPRFSVQHRRQLVLPSLSLSLENDRFLSSSSSSSSFHTRRLFDSARFSLSLSSAETFFVVGGGRRGRGFNASMTFDRRVPPFSPSSVVFLLGHRGFATFSPRQDCITFERGRERESIRVRDESWSIRWDDRSRAAGDCPGKRSNVRRLD